MIHDIDKLVAEARDTKGPQPASTYTDHYMRLMRAAECTYDGPFDRGAIHREATALAEADAARARADVLKMAEAAE